MTSYTSIASIEDARSARHPISAVVSSLTTVKERVSPVMLGAHSSESPRALTEPDNMARLPAPPEGWTSGVPQSSTATSSSRSASSAASSQRSISEPELMALVVEKRLRASSESFQSVGTKTRLGSAGGRERSNREEGKLASLSKRDGRDIQEVNTRDTLDLCHTKIEKLPDGLVAIIKDDVVRLALGYNLITKIPDSFSELRCVRYLNVRANNISTFPAAICKMPSLEILDISRNKIRALPAEPGRLLALRVFSLSGNRVVRLMPWVGKMKHLRVLKMENNLIEWPPPHISKMPNVTLQRPPSSAGSVAVEKDIVRKFEERQMVVWIAKLQSWINDSHVVQRSESSKSASLPGQSIVDEPTETDLLDFPVVAPSVIATVESAPSGSTAIEPGPASDHSDGPVTPKNNDGRQDDHATWSHLPSPAAESPLQSQEPADREAILPYDRYHDASRQLPNNHPRDPVPPIPKHFSPHTPSHSNGASSSEARMLTPGTNLSGFTDRSTGPSLTISRRQENDSLLKSQHGRNNSHSVGQAASLLQPGGRRTLNTKKSLPDMRLSHEDILSERSNGVRETASTSLTSKTAEVPSRQASQDSEMVSHAPTLPLRRPSNAPRRPPLPQSASNPLGYHSKAGGWTSSTPSPNQQSSSSSGGGLRKLSLPTVGATQAAAEAAAAAMAARTPYTHTPPRTDGHGRMPSDKGDSGPSSRSDSPTVVRNPADFERNSYFRRLSTLPPSTIAKAVPLPVLKFVDGTRGVLFALSQIHAALKQYILFATDDRVSSQFNRVLDIASGSMTTFINSLDRFDSLSLRGTPEPSVISGVLMTCKESVVTFRKVVSVLQLQLRALQSSADVRFTRTLLLMLYGSMAEVSNSWTAMAPQVESVLPYLTADSDTNAVTGSSGATTARAQGVGLLKSNAMAGSTPTLPSIAEAPSTVRSARPYTQPQKPNRRRHAGSFSAHDVAQGANIPPSASQTQPFNLGDLQASAAYGTPARVMRRPAAASGTMGVHTPSTSATASGSADYFGTVQATQSVGGAPGTPGASSGGPIRPFAAGSVPASPSKKRSNSNTSSSGETSGFVANGLNGMTPIATTSSAATSVSHQKHSKSASNGNSAGLGVLPGMATEKVTIDDHLLVLVDQITALSEDVWLNLLKHLAGVGIDSEPATPTGPGSTRSRSNTATSLKESNPASTDSADGRLAPAETAAALSKKLRDLRDLTHNTAELTGRLRETYHCVKEEEEQRLASSGHKSSEDEGSGSSDHQHPSMLAMKSGGGLSRAGETALELISQDLVKRLFEETQQFVRAIVNISTLIKAISTSHTFPRELRRSLGEVTQSCSTLTVHLLWLSPTSLS